MRAECAERWLPQSSASSRIMRDARHSSVAGPPPAPLIETQPAQRDLCKSARKARTGTGSRPTSWIWGPVSGGRGGGAGPRGQGFAKLHPYKRSFDDGVPRAEYDAVCHGWSSLKELCPEAGGARRAGAEIAGGRPRAEAAQGAHSEAERRAAADADRARQPSRSVGARRRGHRQGEVGPRRRL